MPSRQQQVDLVLSTLKFDAIGVASFGPLDLDRGSAKCVALGHHAV
jgi:hypothetical protein